MSNLKEIKTFSMTKMIILELIVVGVVLKVGDLIRRIVSSLVITRYIPIAIAAAVCTYLLVKFTAKKVFQHEHEDFIKKIKIIPIIVAAIILIYGILSVSQNASKLTKTMSPYLSLYSSSYTEMYNKAIEDAKGPAVISWIITFVIYLGASEGTTFMMKNRVYDSFKRDEFIPSENETTNMENITNSEMDSDLNENDKNDSFNNIKWNL